MRSSNIFLIGASGVGKTPISQGIAQTLNMRTVGASGWIKAQYTGPKQVLINDVVYDGSSVKHTTEYGKAYVHEITTLSRTKLAENPDACILYLRNAGVEDGGCVIDGVRNPRDFMMTFRPEVDLVVFLECAHRQAMTAFEEDGCAAILQNVKWMHANLTPPDRHYGLRVVYGFGEESVETLQEGEFDVIKASSPDGRISAEVLRRVVEWCKQKRSWRPDLQRVQHPIRPINCFVEDRVFFNDAHVDGKTEAVMVGVSSYTGCALTVTVITKTGSMFCDVPLHRIWQIEANSSSEDRLDLSHLVYKNCPSENVLIAELPTPNEGRVVALFQRGSVRHEGRYLFTVEWPGDNELLHFVALSNGQYALLPNHKLQFGDGPLDAVMPPYLKLRQTWRV